MSVLMNLKKAKNQIFATWYDSEKKGFVTEPFKGFPIKKVIGELRYRGVVCPHNACKISA